MFAQGPLWIVFIQRRKMVEVPPRQTRPIAYQREKWGFALAIK